MFRNAFEQNTHFLHKLATYVLRGNFMIKKMPKKFGAFLAFCYGFEPRLK